MSKSMLTSLFNFASIVLVCEQFQLANCFVTLQAVRAPKDVSGAAVAVGLIQHNLSTTTPTTIIISRHHSCLSSGNNNNDEGAPTTKSRTSLSSTSSPRPDSSNYLDILASNTPLLDTRAPCEFARGSFPNTYSIPLLNDEQRRLIGTCYKEKGQDSAIALGKTLVIGADDADTDASTDYDSYNADAFSNKSELVQSWKDHVELHPNGYLYCFRGGLRSHIVQQWLQEAGVHYPLIIGGYKAMRSSLLEDLELSLQSLPIILIGGRTCSGKTIALLQLSRYVDLEGLANHRGSTIGGLARGEQPAQIDFENSIIIDFHRHVLQSPLLPVFMEDEGTRIGRLNLPIPMNRPMADDFPLVILETPLQQRVDICIEEYVTNPFLKYVGECTGNSTSSEEVQAHAKIRRKFFGAIERVKKGLNKKLGSDNQMVGDFENAFDLFESSNASNIDGFRKPIQSMLVDYYDPMYDYQMNKRQGEILLIW